MNELTSLIAKLERIVALLQAHKNSPVAVQSGLGSYQDATLAASPTAGTSQLLGVAPALGGVPGDNVANVSKVYTVAKNCLHTHVTLDPTVPADVGCAEAVSYVLKNAGAIGFPVTGFASTSLLYAWLRNNAQRVMIPQPGDVVISPSGTSTKGTLHGHTGIVAKFGILSNDSDTGLFMEKYTQSSWQMFFGVKLGFPVLYFRTK